MPQAVFPEGGLTRDGLMREPRLGVVDYMLRGFWLDGERDLVFIPLGLNYDRVLEDRTLLLAADPEARKPGRFWAAWNTLATLPVKPPSTAPKPATTADTDTSRHHADRTTASPLCRRCPPGRRRA